MVEADRLANFTEAGPPPCSPQMPSLMFGRVLQPLLGNQLDHRTDAHLPSMVTKSRTRIPPAGSSSRDFGVSSRIMKAKVKVTVGSLVPKEKNSRRVGDLVGGDRRAQRQLDHRADVTVRRHAGLVGHFNLATRVDAGLELGLMPTSGTMISGATCSPLAATGSRFEDKRTCIS